MKLYTEEELLKAIQYGRDYYDGWVMTEPEILKQLIPIELPSDEEIKEAAPYVPQDSHDYYYGEREGFKEGANWMKEQILKQNK